MNIGFFSEVYKPVINGVVYSMQSFRKGLEQKGNKVYIYTTGYRGYKEKDPKIFRCPILSLKLGYGLAIASKILYSKKAMQVMDSLDIVHAQHPYAVGGFGMKMAKQRGIPVVLTSHSQYEQFSHYVPLNQKFVKHAIRNGVKKFANKCDCIIAPSPSIKKILKNHYKIKTRIEVVPNGIDLGLFRIKDGKGIRKKYKLIKGKTLLYSGRLSKEKRVDFLLKAMNLIIKKEPEAKLLVAGDGPDRQRLQKMIKKNKLQENVILTGFVPYKDMPRYYCAADLFVTGSKSEVHPLTIIEAMATGAVPVAVKAPGSKDIMKNNFDGILTKDEHSAFAKQILILLNDKRKIKQMQQNAKKTAEKYSIPETTKRLLTLYTSLIKEKQK